MAKTPISKVLLLDGVETPTEGAAVDIAVYDKQAEPTSNFLASVSGSGTVSATVSVDVSSDGLRWIELAEMSLIGESSDSDGFAADVPWQYVRGRLTEIAGIGAAVRLLMGA